MNGYTKQLNLKKKILIKGEIEVLTGLHIGGTNNAMSIGGIDSAVIRNPVDNMPYIPGSSLKGKMRSLLEIAYGAIIKKKMGNVSYVGDDNPSLITSKLFGTANRDTEKQRPSRIIVRDAKLLNPDTLSKTELLYTEGKTEVVIDRITSAAVPRQLERVPAGAIFQLDLVLNIMEEDGNDDEKILLEHLFKALEMVQDDYLGGSGSRGSGQVSFKINEVKGRTAEYYVQQQEEEDLLNDYKVKYIPESMHIN